MIYFFFPRQCRVGLQVYHANAEQTYKVIGDVDGWPTTRGDYTPSGEVCPVFDAGFVPVWERVWLVIITSFMAS